MSSRSRCCSCLLLLALVAAPAAPAATASGDPVLVREFVSATPPTPQSHASTLVQTADGQLLAAWFGGTAERKPDVAIWLSRRDATGWSTPVAVADGRQLGGRRYPSWNPVLFQPRRGPLLLFYKVGPDPSHWWGMQMSSSDGGRHWSASHRLPRGILGPIRNKPVQLANGSIVSPSSSEAGRWLVHFERSSDGGRRWSRGPAVNDPRRIEAIQPSVLDLGGGKLLALGRTKQDHVFEIHSRDGGRHWGPMSLLALANPNAAVDAVRLRDGRFLMVFNPEPAGKQWWDGRQRIDLALSEDGEHWRDALTLDSEDGQEFSYPAIIQTSDGLVHVSYTWKRLRIRHLVIDPARLR